MIGSNMGQITEDYVSFETAKLLKEKGFEEECYLHYSSNGKMQHWNYQSPIDGISAPTLQMAMKWLRKSHNITVIPGVRIPDSIYGTPICGTIECYWVGIWYVPKNNGGALCFISPTPEKGYPTYEEACEAGIKYCLKYLLLQDITDITR